MGKITKQELYDIFGFDARFPGRFLKTPLGKILQKTDMKKKAWKEELHAQLLDRYPNLGNYFSQCFSNIYGVQAGYYKSANFALLEFTGILPEEYLKFKSPEDIPTKEEEEPCVRSEDEVDKWLRETSSVLLSPPPDSASSSEDIASGQTPQTTSSSNAPLSQLVPTPPTPDPSSTALNPDLSSVYSPDDEQPHSYQLSASLYPSSYPSPTPEPPSSYPSSSSYSSVPGEPSPLPSYAAPAQPSLPYPMQPPHSAYPYPSPVPQSSSPQQPFPQATSYPLPRSSVYPSTSSQLSPSYSSLAQQPSSSYPIATHVSPFHPAGPSHLLSPPPTPLSLPGSPAVPDLASYAPNPFSFPSSSPQLHQEFSGRLLHNSNPDWLNPFHQASRFHEHGANSPSVPEPPLDRW